MKYLENKAFLRKMFHKSCNLKESRF